MMIQYPVLQYFPPIFFLVLAASIVYIRVSGKNPLIGLEKQLMKVWLLILAMNIIPPKISISTAASETDISTISLQVNNLSIMLFSLAVALIITSLFTDYKQPMYVAAFYIVVSIIHAYFNLPILGNPIANVLYLISLPFTLLYIGIYLKGQQVRGQ